MAQRMKLCTLYFDAEVQDPFYLRCRVNGKSPYDERVMSMPQLTEKTHQFVAASQTNIPFKAGNYFFFIFNFENYFHFLYDTLPYLYFYFSVCPRHKLLLPKGHKFLKFQSEMLSLMGIDLEKDIEFAEEAIYERLYVPTSLTHGHHFDGSSASNTKPDASAYVVWESLRKSADFYAPTPKKFYVSRRSHIHGDASNIGTNYTTRRRCLNEDAVVELVKSYGYTEVFCETMSTEQKIATFGGATHILGFIGGGMANALFSPSNTKIACILTPEFNRINERFAHSMNHCALTMLDITSLAPYNGDFPLYTRVSIIDPTEPYFQKIGEIHDFLNGKYVVHLSTETIAGFSLTANLVVATYTAAQLSALDHGLNSPFVCDVTALQTYLESISESKE